MAYDFPAAPVLGDLYQGYFWDGEKWLAGNSVGPVVATRKNYIDNGGMMVSQENGSTAVGVNTYPVDRFFVNGLSPPVVISTQQVASPTPGGSPNRLRITVTTADPTIDAPDYFRIWHNMEGTRVADLMFGTAQAKTFTLRFGVKAPAGTYCVSFQNSGETRVYIAEYVISAAEANIAVVKTVTIPGDTAGTWRTDIGTGLIVGWILICGPNYQRPAGAWLTTAGYHMASASQFNFLGTVGNVFELFDVALVEGSTAPPYVLPDYVDELARCQRYWWCSSPDAPKGTLIGKLCGHTATAGVICFSSWFFPVTMRIVPTLQIWSGGVQNQVRVTVNGTLLTTGGAPGNSYLGRNGGTLVTVPSVTANQWVDFDFIADARL